MTAIVNKFAVVILPRMRLGSIHKLACLCSPTSGGSRFHILSIAIEVLYRKLSVGGYDYYRVLMSRHIDFVEPRNLSVFQMCHVGFESGSAAANEAGVCIDSVLLSVTNQTGNNQNLPSWQTLKANLKPIALICECR